MTKTQDQYRMSERNWSLDRDKDPPSTDWTFRSLIWLLINGTCWLCCWLFMAEPVEVLSWVASCSGVKVLDPISRWGALSRDHRRKFWCQKFQPLWWWLMLVDGRQTVDGRSHSVLWGFGVVFFFDFDFDSDFDRPPTANYKLTCDSDGMTERLADWSIQDRELNRMAGNTISVNVIGPMIAVLAASVLSWIQPVTRDVTFGSIIDGLRVPVLF